MNQYITKETKSNIEPTWNTMTNCYEVITDRKTALAIIDLAKYVNESEVSIKITTEWNYKDKLDIVVKAETHYLFTIERVANILRTIEKIAQITEEETEEEII